MELCEDWEKGYGDCLEVSGECLKVFDDCVEV